MLDELKEEAIVNKVGGRFKLSTLIQKRMVALNAGQKPLIDVRGGGQNCPSLFRRSCRTRSISTPLGTFKRKTKPLWPTFLAHIPACLEQFHHHQAPRQEPRVTSEWEGMKDRKETMIRDSAKQESVLKQGVSKLCEAHHLCLPGCGGPSTCRAWLDPPYRDQTCIESLKRSRLKFSFLLHPYPLLVFLPTTEPNGLLSRRSKDRIT